MPDGLLTVGVIAVLPFLTQPFSTGGCPVLGLRSPSAGASLPDNTDKLRPKLRLARSPAERK